MRLETDLDSSLRLRPEVVFVDRDILLVESGGKRTLSVNLAEVTKAYVEEGTGIARLVLETKGEGPLEVAYFTKRKANEFRSFAVALNNHLLREGIIEPYREEGRKWSRSSTLKWLFTFLTPYKRRLIIGVLFSVILTALNLVPPYLLVLLIDSFKTGATDFGFFETLTLVLLGTYALIALATVGQGYFLNILGQRVVNDLRLRVYERVTRLSSTFVERMTTGRILSRLTTDVGNAQWLMVWGTPTLLVNGLTLIGIGVILFFLDPHLALFVLIPVPFIVYALISYRSRSHLTYHRNWRRSADATAMVTDTIPGFFVVKSFAKEDFEAKKLSSALDNLYQSQIDATKMNLSYWPLLGFVTAVATVGIWWFGGNQVFFNGVNYAILVGFVAYMAQFYAPINNLSNIVPFIQQAVTSGDRLREVMEGEMEDNSKSKRLRPSLSGDLVFKDVWFGYEPYNPVVKALNLNIRGKTKVAVVGRSGSGKTSIAKLLLRFYKVDRGEIAIGGTPIADVDLAYLREKVSYVPQDVFLFDASVAYNVSYGSMEQDPRRFSPGKVLTACVESDIHYEIMRLPMAYDTSLGEKGSQLSGGQRQRISLARAIMEDPDVMILDEATSQLDVLSEYEVFRTMMKVAEGKTTILVTHNAREAMAADSVVVMKEGVVVQSGAPGELLATPGEFRKMFQDYAELGPLAIKNGGDVDHQQSSVYVLSSPKVVSGNRQSRVTVTSGSQRFENVMPVSPFPISNPRFVLLSQGMDRAPSLPVIEDYESLDAESQDALVKALRFNRLKFEVDSVEKIEVKGDELVWHVSTKEGDAVVNTRGRRNVIVQEKSIVLFDVNDNVYEISTKNVNHKSLKMLNRTL